MEPRHWRSRDLLLGAATSSALFTAPTYGMILLGLKDRSGQPISGSVLLIAAIAGAVFGAFNTWRTGHFLGDNRWAGRTNLGRLAVELTGASSGQPNEAKATWTVAKLAVIPAAICGILIGAQSVSEADSVERLLLICGGLAFGAGASVLVIVWAVYRVFGFRPIVFLAYALLGGFTGFFAGALLGNVFDSWWPWLLGPLGVLIGVAIAWIIPRPAESGENTVGSGTAQQIPHLDRGAEP